MLAPPLPSPFQLLKYQGRQCNSKCVLPSLSSSHLVSFLSIFELEIILKFHKTGVLISEVHTSSHMAKLINSACLFFLLALVFFSEFFCIEGRNLELGKNLKCVKKCLNSNAETSSPEMHKEITSPNHFKTSGFRIMDQGTPESYRPTTPGHSPGVGHSDHN